MIFFPPSFHIILGSSLKSPQILELSGIGNPDILSSIDIPVNVDLRGVGENVQEHMYIGVVLGMCRSVSPETSHDDVSCSAELPDNVPDKTLDLLQDPAVAAEQFELLYVFESSLKVYLNLTVVADRAKGEGMFTMGITSFTFQPLQSYSGRADEIHRAAELAILDGEEHNLYPPGLIEQYKIQLAKLKRGASGCEIIVIPGFLGSPSEYLS